MPKRKPDENAETSRAGKRGGKRTTTRAQGWGGPAQGEGDSERYVFDEAGPGRGHKSVEGEARRVRNERRTEALEQFYWDVARGEAQAIDAIRLSAASMLLNRLSPKDGPKGEPTVIVINNSLRDECPPSK